MSHPAGSSRRPVDKKAGRRPVRPARVKKAMEAQRIATLEQAAMNFDAARACSTFNDLPISHLTKQGLKKAFFTEMTDIQSKSIPACLQGKDVLGAARTGSGKTLAFLIPILEILYRRKWGPQDGLGALVISPTRELAVQIFEVLRAIGSYHSLSAGLIIGGKNLKDERDRLTRMNILVATPGRLLQHMDQTVGFGADNLQMLVLDEADRILDMGFAKTLTALLSHLPKSRQTLLFSATQTQSVNDLARLSLKDPVHIGVQELGSEGATPKGLEQYYAVSELDKKLDILWGFIKTHLRCKTLVFISCCKQVRFVYETFCKMQPGIPLLHLHGKQKQSTRLGVYSRFTSASQAVLFATDIAARGLDFPAVDWVLQIDAPEDAETHIHRVGRTARYESAGKSLLLLLPSEEEGMKAALDKKGIVISKIKIKPSKTQSIQIQLQNLAFQDPEIKYLGQRAFISYLRSVYLHKDKTIFKPHELPVQRFAESLGLPGTPKIKFLSREASKSAKNAPRSAAADSSHVPKHAFEARLNDSDSENEAGHERSASSEEEGPTAKATAKPAVRTKYDRMFTRKNQGILSEAYRKLVDRGSSGEEDEDFITLKRTDHDLSLPGQSTAHDENLSKRKAKLGKAKRAIAKYGGLGKRLVFDESGQPHELYELVDAERVYDNGGVTGVMDAGHRFAEGEREKMIETDLVDKKEAKAKRSEKKRRKKEREKPTSQVEGRPAILALPSASDEDASGVSSAEEVERLPKRTRRSNHRDDLSDEERTALRLLRTNA